MLFADDLRTIGLSEQLVTDVVTFLENSAGDLSTARPDGVGGHAFGASPASTGCSGDAAKAHAKVYSAMTDMVAGLRGYQESLHDMAKKTWDVDTTTEAEIKTHLTRSAACIADKYASPSTCALPGASSSGDEG